MGVVYLATKVLEEIDAYQLAQEYNRRLMSSLRRRSPDQLARSRVDTRSGKTFGVGYAFHFEGTGLW